MATKKISELTNVPSVQDSDLLIVETTEGTKSINKGNLISSTEKSVWNKKQEQIKAASITLFSNGWSGNDTFTQAVSIPEATINSKIDLQPNSTTLNQLINDDVCALYVENDSGVFTAYAIGATPTVDLTIQVTITEVE